MLMQLNNPTIIAATLITFFKAYVIRRPTKNPPSIVAAAGPRLSMLVF